MRVGARAHRGLEQVQADWNCVHHCGNQHDVRSALTMACCSSPLHTICGSGVWITPCARLPSCDGTARDTALYHDSRDNFRAVEELLLQVADECRQ